jgi:hypothetical protein
LFGDLDVSVSVELETGRKRGGPAPAEVPETEPVPGWATPGLVFHLDHHGYYAVLLSRDPRNSHVLVYKLVKKYHAEPMARDLISWKDLPLREGNPQKEEKLSVQCPGPAITIILQGAPSANSRTPTSKRVKLG